MKKNKKKLTIILGVICAMLMAVSSWYSIVYNDSRVIKKMDSDYTFQIKDLPMYIAIILFVLYIFYLCALGAQTAYHNKQKVMIEHITRTISPKFGLFGFFGFFGFLGFQTYSADKNIFPFIYFIFFGFFGFFYEGKMSDTFMDERYKENKIKAQMTANKIALTIIGIVVFILVEAQNIFMVNLEYTLIAVVITVALSIALDIFLGEYLLYRYDHSEQFDESGE